MENINAGGIVVVCGGFTSGVGIACSFNKILQAVIFCFLLVQDYFNRVLLFLFNNDRWR
jgi:hypothetical protein